MTTRFSLPAFLARRLPRFRRAYRALDALAARETWARADIEQWQLERLNRLWASARKHVPYYRELAVQRKLPATFSCLAHYQSCMPLLSKDEVRRQGKELLSKRAEPGRWERSSGSTGIPTSAFWGRRARLESLQGKYRFYAQWDIDFFDRMVFVWGHPPAAASAWRRSWSTLHRWGTDRLRNRLRLPPDLVTNQMLHSHLQQITAFRPALVYSYTTVLYLLAQTAAATGFSCPSLRVINYTAEPGLPRLVRSISEGFGVPTIGEYGSSECGFIAGEGPDRQLRVREDMMFLETLAREDGAYDIVVTPLTNPSFPLLRYQLGDVTSSELIRPQRGLAVLESVAGRCNDLLLLGSGQYLGAAGLEQVFEQYPFVRRYRVHQSADGSCVAQLELPSDVAGMTLEALRHALEKILEGQPVTIEVSQVLPPQPRGKHRWITSDAASPAALNSLEKRRMAAVR
jgi:phenylacetate-CoA ligase